MVQLDQGGKTSFDRIVGLDTFTTFAHHYRQFILKDSDFIQRKDLVKKFVKKVEVGAESVKIHFTVDQEHYRQELALNCRAETVVAAPERTWLLRSGLRGHSLRSLTALAQAACPH